MPAVTAAPASGAGGSVRQVPLIASESTSDSGGTSSSGSGTTNSTTTIGPLSTATSQSGYALAVDCLLACLLACLLTRIHQQRQHELGAPDGGVRSTALASHRTDGQRHLLQHARLLDERGHRHVVAQLYPSRLPAAHRGALCRPQPRQHDPPAVLAVLQAPQWFDL